MVLGLRPSYDAYSFFAEFVVLIKVFYGYYPRYDGSRYDMGRYMHDQYWLVIFSLLKTFRALVTPCNFP